MKRHGDGKSRPSWRRRLNACRSPSTESIAELPDSHPVNEDSSFRRSASTGNGLLAAVDSGGVADWPTDDGEDTIVIHVPRADGPPPQCRARFPVDGSGRRHGYSRNPGALAPYGHNTLPAVNGNSGVLPRAPSGPNVQDSSCRGTRNSPFCPCLSPNDSDDEGNRETVSSIATPLMHS